MKKRVSFAETDKFKSGPRIKLFEPEVIIDVDDKEYDHPGVHLSIFSDIVLPF
jgi:hypothetical protein